jgi:NodT family efflux transporter outer membrane factor (OMF) lipoprotein
MRNPGFTLALLGVLFLAGCNVGPKYVLPATPAPPAFKEGSPTAYKSAPPGTWQPAQPQDAVLKGKWWEMFQEPELNALEEKLNIDNQNIAQFFQNFMAARAQVHEARSAYFPTVSVNPAYSRSGVGSGKGSATSLAPTSGASTSPVSNSIGSSISNYSLPFEVSWEPDLWGRIRNTVGQFRSASQVSAADLENERLSEQATLAETFFEIRGQDALQRINDDTVQTDRQALALNRSLFETGINDQEVVLQAQAALETAQAASIGIANNRALFEHAIATLIGTAASNFSMPVKELTTAVPAIPVGVPSELLQRRPDIAAAERTMAEANATIGVEKAAYYPTVSLSGAGGLETSIVSKLFTLPALFWSVGASATQTIFDAGLRRATMTQFTATYNADVAAYRQTVLTAFQQVEDNIASLRILSQQIARQHAAVQASEQFLEIAQARYQTGLDPYLNVVTAQSTLLSNQQAEVTLRVNEMSAAVQLIQALGGGWDSKQLPSGN